MMYDLFNMLLHSVCWNFVKDFCIYVHQPAGLQIQWGFLVTLPDPQVGKSVVVPRTFTTVQELLWYNCFTVCGLSAPQFYNGANGDLFLDNLGHTPCFPGMLLSEPQSWWQATADLCLLRRHSNTQRQVWLSLLWGSLLLSLGPGEYKVLFVPSKHLWQV